MANIVADALRSLHLPHAAWAKEYGLAVFAAPRADAAAVLAPHQAHPHVAAGLHISTSIATHARPRRGPATTKRDSKDATEPSPASFPPNSRSDETRYHAAPAHGCGRGRDVHSSSDGKREQNGEGVSARPLDQVGMSTPDDDDDPRENADDDDQKEVDVDLTLETLLVPHAQHAGVCVGVVVQRVSGSWCAHPLLRAGYSENCGTDRSEKQPPNATEPSRADCNKPRSSGMGSPHDWNSQAPGCCRETSKEDFDHAENRSSMRDGEVCMSGSCPVTLLLGRFIHFSDYGELVLILSSNRRSKMSASSKCGANSSPKAIVQCFRMTRPGTWSHLWATVEENALRSGRDLRDTDVCDADHARFCIVGCNGSPVVPCGRPEQCTDRQAKKRFLETRHGSRRGAYSTWDHLSPSDAAMVEECICMATERIDKTAATAIESVAPVQANEEQGMWGSSGANPASLAAGSFAPCLVDFARAHAGSFDGQLTMLAGWNGTRTWMNRRATARGDRIADPLLASSLRQAAVQSWLTVDPPSPPGRPGPPNVPSLLQNGAMESPLTYEGSDARPQASRGMSRKRESSDDMCPQNSTYEPSLAAPSRANGSMPDCSVSKAGCAPTSSGTKRFKTFTGGAIDVRPAVERSPNVEKPEGSLRGLPESTLRRSKGNESQSSHGLMALSAVCQLACSMDTPPQKQAKDRSTTMLGEENSGPKREGSRLSPHSESLPDAPVYGVERARPRLQKPNHSVIQVTDPPQLPSASARKVESQQPDASKRPLPQFQTLGTTVSAVGPTLSIHRGGPQKSSAASGRAARNCDFVCNPVLRIDIGPNTFAPLQKSTPEMSESGSRLRSIARSCNDEQGGQNSCSLPPPPPRGGSLSTPRSDQAPMLAPLLPPMSSSQSRRRIAPLSPILPPLSQHSGEHSRSTRNRSSIFGVGVLGGGEHSAGTFRSPAPSASFGLGEICPPYQNLGETSYAAPSWRSGGSTQLDMSRGVVMSTPELDNTVTRARAADAHQGNSHAQAIGPVDVSPVTTSKHGSTLSHGAPPGPEYNPTTSSQQQQQQQQQQHRHVDAAKPTGSQERFAMETAHAPGQGSCNAAEQRYPRTSGTGAGDARDQAFPPIGPNVAHRQMGAPATDSAYRRPQARPHVQANPTDHRSQGYDSATSAAVNTSPPAAGTHAGSSPSYAAGCNMDISRGQASSIPGGVPTGVPNGGRTGIAPQPTQADMYPAARRDALRQSRAVEAVRTGPGIAPGEVPSRSGEQFSRVVGTTIAVAESRHNSGPTVVPGGDLGKRADGHAHGGRAHGPQLDRGSTPAMALGQPGSRQPSEAGRGRPAPSAGGGAVVPLGQQAPPGMPQKTADEIKAEKKMLRKVKNREAAARSNQKRKQKDDALKAAVTQFREKLTELQTREMTLRSENERLRAALEHRHGERRHARAQR